MKSDTVITSFFESLPHPAMKDMSSVDWDDYWLGRFVRAWRQHDAIAYTDPDRRIMQSAMLLCAKVANNLSKPLTLSMEIPGSRIINKQEHLKMRIEPWIVETLSLENKRDYPRLPLRKNIDQWSDEELGRFARPFVIFEDDPTMMAMLASSALDLIEPMIELNLMRGRADIMGISHEELQFGDWMLIIERDAPEYSMIMLPMPDVVQ